MGWFNFELIKQSGEFAWNFSFHLEGENSKWQERKMWMNIL